DAAWTSDWRARSKGLMSGSMMILADPTISPATSHLLVVLLGHLGDGLRLLGCHLASTATGPTAFPSTRRGLWVQRGHVHFLFEGLPVLRPHERHDVGLHEVDEPGHPEFQ